MENKQNWDFLGNQPSYKLRKRRLGKLMRFCKENSYQPKNRKIVVKRSKHTNGIFYEFCNDLDKEIFWRVFNRKSKEKLISQDKLDFFKLCGLQFFVIREEYQV
tara:strand:+ start:159 stop:470 length:312 start_codon:yes stop_codon:yes gene_type:complete